MTYDDLMVQLSSSITYVGGLCEHIRTTKGQALYLIEHYVTSLSCLAINHNHERLSVSYRD